MTEEIKSLSDRWFKSMMHDWRRLLTPIAPLAREVLASSNCDELDDNIDGQMFSALFLELIRQPSLRPTKVSADSVTGELGNLFLSRIEELGGIRVTAEDALAVSQASLLLSQALLRFYLDVFDNREICAELQSFNIREFLYDINIPSEFRQGVRACFESIICITTLAWALVAGERTEAWIVAELVDRWRSGQESYLLLLLAMMREAEIRLESPLPASLQARVGLLAMERTVPDLSSARQRSESMARDLRIIAEHASRQPDGIWPRQLPTNDY